MASNKIDAYRAWAGILLVMLYLTSIVDMYPDYTMFQYLRGILLTAILILAMNSLV